jgi:hypothetical protein
MQDYCHRCGEELPAGHGESSFCPRCGAPQLTLSIENQTIPEPEPDPAATTGAVPPPRPFVVDWKAAIRCAAIVAAIGAALAIGSVRIDALSPVSFLWVMSASLVAMSLYQKLRPAAWIDVRIGARIGVVVGLCLAIALGASMAGWGVISRFALHSMGSFDAQLTTVLAQAQVTMQQKAAQQSTPLPPWFVGLVKSPEFRAGCVLFWSAFLAGCILLISTIGGAFAGLLRTRRGQLV